MREAPPVPAAVGPVTGAFVGSTYGVEALPVDLLEGMELTWVVDTLARDLIAQLTGNPMAMGTARHPTPPGIGGTRLGEGLSG